MRGPAGTGVAFLGIRAINRILTLGGRFVGGLIDWAAAAVPCGILRVGTL